MCVYVCACVVEQPQILSLFSFFFFVEKREKKSVVEQPQILKSQHPCHLLKITHIYIYIYTSIHIYKFSKVSDLVHFPMQSIHRRGF